MSRKMYLLPFDQYERMRSGITYTEEKLNDLDKELQTIMRKEEYDEETKALLYQQTLQKYLGYKKQKETSSKTDKGEKEIEREEDDTEDKEVNPAMPNDIIISAMPIKYKSRANMLLNSLPTELKWDSKAQIVYNGRTIENSNIIELLKGFVTDSTRDRNRISHTVGWETLKSALKKSNKNPTAKWLSF